MSTFVLNPSDSFIRSYVHTTLPTYTVAGFDLATHMLPSGGDTTSPHRQDATDDFRDMYGISPILNFLSHDQTLQIFAFEKNATNADNFFLRTYHVPLTNWMLLSATIYSCNIFFVGRVCTELTRCLVLKHQLLNQSGGIARNWRSLVHKHR
jgi:hypothetical protein